MLVTEPEVSEGYSVSVSRLRELFTVTNSGEAAGEEPAPLGGLLPQTGQLWWPAILLAALGLLLLLRAFRLRRRKSWGAENGAAQWGCCFCWPPLC